jgi:mxaC protein
VNQAVNVAFEQPLWIAALLLAAVPLATPFQRAAAYSSVDLIPDDSVSEFADWLIRLAAAAAVASIVLGIASPYERERLVEKTGTGAHVVLLVDRSASMNQNFSGQYLGGTSSETKARYAHKLLTEFVQRRTNDLFAMASFSTAPLYTLALTQDHTAILSALRAASSKGKGATNMAAGLSMALDFFTEKPLTGSRVIVLVSDAATRIDADTQNRLRQWFYQARTSLYWVYLRNPTSPKLSQRPKNPNEQTTPEYFLHQFFSNMEIPYKAYGAENQKAMEQAIRDIEQLENKPITYFEKVLKKDLSAYCYGTATALLALLLTVKWMELRAWSVAGR